MTYWLAPGKLFLAGEYVVTLGEPALIAAVAPWGKAMGQAGHGIRGIFPGAPPSQGQLSVDTSDFFSGNRKLGFGSSATAAVLIAAASANTWLPQQLWRSAQQTHQQLTGGSGSGGDLAAVLHGGVGIFARLPDGGYSWRALKFPSQASLLIVKAQSAANTRQWLTRFQKLSDISDNRDFANWRQQLRDCVLGFADANADWSSLLHIVANAYERLQNWLGDDLYPPLFLNCLKLAKELNIPFKPSGAGGGDLGFFYCRDLTTQSKAKTRLDSAGIDVFSLKPTILGLHQVAT